MSPYRMSPDGLKQILRIIASDNDAAASTVESHIAALEAELANVRGAALPAESGALYAATGDNRQERPIGGGPRATYRTVDGLACANCGWSVVEHQDGRLCPVPAEHAPPRPSHAAIEAAMRTDIGQAIWLEWKRAKKDGMAGSKESFAFNVVRVMVEAAYAADHVSQSDRASKRRGGSPKAGGAWSDRVAETLEAERDRPEIARRLRDLRPIADDDGDDPDLIQDRANG